MPSPSTNNNEFAMGTVRQFLRETRAVGVAFAGIGLGTGVGLSTTAMLWAAGMDVVQWGSVSLTCLAAGMFLGFTLVVGYGIRLKTTQDRLSSLERSIDTWCLRTDAISETTSVEAPSFGTAANPMQAVLYPAAFQEEARRQATALLERFMLPRKQ